MKTKNENETTAEDSATEAAFLPTIEQWNDLYAKWHKKMAQSLWKSGRASECEEAVQEAFIKVLGLSDHHRLRDELTPKSEGAWYAFIRRQAEYCLSHYHERDRRFIAFEEFLPAEETFVDGGRCAADGISGTCAVDWCRPDDMDVEWLRREVRCAVADVCLAAGVKARNVEAFVLNVLDECSGAEVVRRVPDVRNANNLYAIKHRVMQLLAHSRERFRLAHEELFAA